MSTSRSQPLTARRWRPQVRQAARPSELWQKFRDLLPRGRTLTASEWNKRHRGIVALLWVHVAGLMVFLYCQGFGVWGAIRPVLPVAVCGVIGMRTEFDRRARSVALVLGLLTASAVLVYGWHGQIEAHFHFFVMIAVLAFYEDWLPFGLAIAYVGIEHGVLGALAPHSVYSHGGNPWFWAAVHAGFVLAASGVAIITWRMNESARAGLRAASQQASAQARRFRVSFESGRLGYGHPRARRPLSAGQRGSVRDGRLLRGGAAEHLAAGADASR